MIVGQSAEKRPTILFIEDEGLLRNTIAQELQDVGFDVREAADADQALSILKEGCEPDLLFTDIRLPGSMDGWQLAEAARDECPDIPIIYATGYSDVQPRQVPNSAFLHKPYRISAVTQVAERLGVPPRPA